MGTLMHLLDTFQKTDALRSLDYKGLLIAFACKDVYNIVSMDNSSVSHFHLLPVTPITIYLVSPNYFE